MSEIKSFIVSAEEDGERIDKLLSSKLENFSRSNAARLIESGDVLLDAESCDKKTKVKLGQEITVQIPEPSPTEIIPQNLPLDIVYEDDDLLVVNKAKGMVVHPAPGHYDGTLVNALMFHCKGSLSGINGEIRPGILHRIDKDTSGLLVVAKNDRSHIFLAEQIKEHSFKREYEAVIQGHLKSASGTISAPIGRSKANRLKMAVTTENSKQAVTHYSVVEEFGGYTHLRLRLETGRTHQIRVHMSYIGHPVAGDALYGAKSVPAFEGQCLHAKTLGFIHPASNEYMEFTSELPEYFENFLRKLR